MMWKYALAVAGLCMLLGAEKGAAQESAALVLDEIVICTSVEDREPVGTNTAFPNTVERLYCFTRISGAQEETAVTHVWYHEGEERARIELSVRGTPWRTWSSKRIIPEWTGTWRVDVLSADGEILGSKGFQVTAQ